jgi:hypothetical protein
MRSSAKRSSRASSNAWQKNDRRAGLAIRKGALSGRDCPTQKPWFLPAGDPAPELGIILDVLKERTKETLETWFDQRSQEWCAQVTVCCADMWDAYHEAAAEKLPNAHAVVDRFHVMKNLNDALNKARRSIQNQADEATKALLKGCRWWLVKIQENLDEEDQAKLE